MITVTAHCPAGFLAAVYALMAVFTKISLPFAHTAILTDMLIWDLLMAIATTVASHICSKLQAAVYTKTAIFTFLAVRLHAGTAIVADMRLKIRVLLAHTAIIALIFLAAFLAVATVLTGVYACHVVEAYFLTDGAKLTLIFAVSILILRIHAWTHLRTARAAVRAVR